MLDKTFAYLEALHTANVDRENDLWADAMEEVKLLRSLPEVVMLAGSSRFKQAFEHVAETLALQGCIVIGKSVFKPGAEWPLDDHAKNLIHAVQFRTCDLANRLHIVNVDGYIGQDTYNLIKYAVRTDRVVSFHEPLISLLDPSRDPVTADHFLKATRRNVDFESAAIG